MNNDRRMLTPRAARGEAGAALLGWLILFQLLDISTTILGLSWGFRELNPLVRSMMHASGLGGLLFSKVLAVALGAYFLCSGRLLLLRRVTALMGFLVAWNLFWLSAR